MASGFNSDAQGFLIGEVIENGRDLARMQTQSIALWKDIRVDVKAIARAVGAQVSNSQRISRPGAAPRAPAGSRTSGGNWRVAPSAATATTGTRGAAAQRTSAAGSRTTVAVTQQRASNGRFTAGQRSGAAASGGAGGGAAASGGGSALFRRMGDRMSKIASTLGAADNIDPTINAAKEIKDVVSPLGRGLFSLFGRTAERKKEVWYRRFLKALTPGARDNKPGQAGGGGGFFGGMGGGVGSMVGSGIGSAAGGLLGGMLGKGKGLLKGGGKLLKRIPILGALIAGAGALGSIFGDDDPSKSADENRTGRYRGVGEAGGMLAGGMAGASLGAAIGTAILPGIGTAIGGFLGGVGGALLGEKFGSKVGEWTKSLVDSDIAGKMLEGWNTTTAFLGAAWDSMATDAKAAWSGITTKAGEWLDSAKSGLDAVGKTLSDAGNAVNGWIKDKTGIDVKQNIGEAADSVKNAAGAAWDKTKSVAGAGWSAAKGYGGEALDAAKAGAAAMVPNTVKRAYDAGSAAAGKVGNVVSGTFKGAEARAMETGKAYGAGNIGGLDDAQTRALVASTALTESAGGKLGVVNSAGYMGRYQAGAGWLADAGHIAGGAGAVKNAMKADGYTNEYKWGQSGGMTKFLKDDKNWNGGMSYDKYLESASTQDSAFKTNSDAAYQQMVKNGTIKAGTSQAEVAGLLKARHIAGMGGAIAVSKGGTGAVDANGTSALKYYNDVALDKNGFHKSLSGGVAGVSNLPSTPAANVPSSVPGTIPKAPEIRDPAIPLNSGAGAGRGSLTVNNPDTVGQNVGDRGIAHVVSGGLGM